jgi:hypothetical protein
MDSTVDLVGFEVMGSDLATSMLVGMADEEHVDASGAGAEVVPLILNCRGFHVDTTGIIKFQFKNPHNGNTYTKVMVAIAGEIYFQRNIIKVYNDYIGSTDCTATAYNAGGVAKIGMHLFR